MKTQRNAAKLLPLFLFICESPFRGSVCADNIPPSIAILWPHVSTGPAADFDQSFNTGTFIKIKADAHDTDGSIASVEFYADTEMIGLATRPPFNALWEVKHHPGIFYGTWKLKAVAIDNLGARTESSPVTISYTTTRPPFIVLPISSPANGAIIPFPGTFLFSAEVLATGDQAAGPVEFFVNSNSAGINDPGAFTATTPPASVMVSDLAEGEHKLTVRFTGVNNAYCTCNGLTNTIRVVKLGLRSPILTPDGRLQFEGVTSFPGKPTTIETSSNLQNWIPLSTIQPSSNIFTFTDPSPASDAHRFYRLLLPP
jgi:hypothetical protein